MPLHFGDNAPNICRQSCDLKTLEADRLHSRQVADMLDGPDRRHVRCFICNLLDLNQTVPRCQCDLPALLPSSVLAVFDRSWGRTVLSESIKIVRVFIGSPGGLEDERRAAREIVQEVNQAHSEHWGCQFKLVGWEDTIPGYQRPQSLINIDLDKCQYFIGVLAIMHLS